MLYFVLFPNLYETLPTLNLWIQKRAIFLIEHLLTVEQEFEIGLTGKACTKNEEYILDIYK
jgi:hypothetical protein